MAYNVSQVYRIHLPSRSHGFNPWVRKIAGEGNGNPLPVLATQLSSILAWNIPWTEEPGRLQLWDHKESGTTGHLSIHE